MDNRVLIAYATRAGSTVEVAQRIGEVLTQQQRAVDVLPVGDVTGLDAYDSVILGSAIRFGKLLPEALAFIEHNQEALQQKSFDVFVVCLTLMRPDEESYSIVSAYLDPVRALVKPAHEGLFSGVMNLSKLKWNERLLIRFLKVAEGDYRQWNLIENWARELQLNPG